MIVLPYRHTIKVISRKNLDQSQIDPVTRNPFALNEKAIYCEIKSTFVSTIDGWNHLDKCPLCGLNTTIGKSRESQPFIKRNGPKNKNVQNIRSKNKSGPQAARRNGAQNSKIAADHRSSSKSIIWPFFLAALVLIISVAIGFISFVLGFWLGNLIQTAQIVQAKPSHIAINTISTEGLHDTKAPIKFSKTSTPAPQPTTTLISQSHILPRKSPASTSFAAPHLLVLERSKALFLIEPQLPFYVKLVSSKSLNNAEFSSIFPSYNEVLETVNNWRRAGTIHRDCLHVNRCPTHDGARYIAFLFGPYTSHDSALYALNGQEISKRSWVSLRSNRINLSNPINI